MLKVTVVGGSGKAGKEFTAKDAAHADRIKARIKAQAGTGNSITFKTKSI